MKTPSFLQVFFILPWPCLCIFFFRNRNLTFYRRYPMNSNLEKNNLTSLYVPQIPTPIIPEDFSKLKNNLSTDKIPSPSFETSSPKAQSNEKASWKQLWNEFKSFTHRHDALSSRERFKAMFQRDLGQLEGMAKAAGEELLDFLEGESPLTGITTKDIAEELPQLEEKIINPGIEFLQADPRTQGKMGGRFIVKTLAFGFGAARHLGTSAIKLLQKINWK